MTHTKTHNTHISPDMTYAQKGNWLKPTAYLHLPYPIKNNNPENQFIKERHVLFFILLNQIIILNFFCFNTFDSMLKRELHNLISSLLSFHHFTLQTEAHLYLTFILTFPNSKINKPLKF